MLVADPAEGKRGEDIKLWPRTGKNRAIEPGASKGQQADGAQFM